MEHHSFQTINRMKTVLDFTHAEQCTSDTIILSSEMQNLVYRTINYTEL